MQVNNKMKQFKKNDMIVSFKSGNDSFKNIFSPFGSSSVKRMRAQTFKSQERPKNINKFQIAQDYKYNLLSQRKFSFGKNMPSFLESIKFEQQPKPKK